jgi:hypothetical protein
MQQASRDRFANARARTGDERPAKQVIVVRHFALFRDLQRL